MGDGSARLAGHSVPLGLLAGLLLGIGWARLSGGSPRRLAADAADRWPLSATRGRTDIVRGEAYEALGDHTRAGLFYLRAYRSDPENFWAVADLAEFYASHGTAAARRQRSGPWVEELRRRFSGNRSFSAVMDRVERAASKWP